MPSSGDLPWPFSLKMLPDDEGRRDVSQGQAPSDPAKKRLCQAYFTYKGQRKILQWQGPAGGESLLQIVRTAFNVAEHKLVYLRNLDTQDILDVDLPMSENREYVVRVEPEDTGDFNIVPCMVNLCTFNYAAGCSDRRDLARQLE